MNYLHVDRVEIDFNQIREKNILSIISCGSIKDNTIEGAIFCHDGYILPYFWKEIFIDKSLYVRFKNIAIINGNIFMKRMNIV